MKNDDLSRLIYAAQGGNAINDTPHLLRVLADETSNPQLKRAARERALMLHEGLRMARAAKPLGLRDSFRAAAGRLLNGLSRPFQERTQDWIVEVTRDDPTDLAERRDRFLEEALELYQALGGTAEDATNLVTYTYGRPSGVPGQEVGGVMNTLGALCEYAYLDMDEEAERELERVWDPSVIAKVKRKRASRHGRGPLPGATDNVVTPSTALLETERAELVAANEAAPGWGAAVGARGERIKEIDRELIRRRAAP